MWQTDKFVFWGHITIQDIQLDILRSSQKVLGLHKMEYDCICVQRFPTSISKLQVLEQSGKFRQLHHCTVMQTLKPSQDHTIAYHDITMIKI